MSTEQKTIKVLPLGDGAAHLQNTVVKDNQCYICGAPLTEDSVLLRINDKQMAFACTHHHGVVQEFIRQFKTTPLGWRKHARESDG